MSAPNFHLHQSADLAKIVNGELAMQNEFPHQVGLLSNNGFICGASILSTVLILTAAHCLEFKSPRYLKIIAGEHDRNATEGSEQVRAVKAIYLHENFVRTGNGAKNDIGVILLSERLEYTKHVQNISLPKPGEEFEGHATIKGWGTAHEAEESPTITLRKAMIPLIPLDQCQWNYSLAAVPREVTDNMLCAGAPGRDSCRGDSGGGMLCYPTGKVDVNREVLCGIVSWAEGCGVPGFPGVYTKVSQYIAWIENAEHLIRERARCRTDEFYCSSRCISRTALCDGVRDCDQGEDEMGCETYKPCGKDHFRCNRGNCRVRSELCDGINNCRDASDEFKCPTVNNTCFVEEHQCGANGRCIPSDWVCNGLFDCDDLTDEINCVGGLEPNVTEISPTRSYSDLQKCPTEEFFCSSKCISRAAVCNDVIDCEDGSDEIGCGYKNGTACATTYFRCNNGRCVERRQICDERNDCWDLSDELKCAQLDTICIEGEFQCRENSRCIPESWLCDNVKDCLDGRDEWNCSQNSDLSSSIFHSDLERCSSDHFYCASACLPRSVICNGTAECGDGRDEVGCLFEEPCPSDRVRCNDAMCVESDWVCDGEKDCPDGSDELKCAPANNATCDKAEFQCAPGGRCVPISWKCNNLIDCDNASDEHNCDFSTTPITLGSKYPVKGKSHSYGPWRFILSSHLQHINFTFV